MKITLVISSLRAGGAERVICLLANYWAEQDNVVTIVTFDTPEQKPFYVIDTPIKLLQLDSLTATNQPNFYNRIKEIIKRVIRLRLSIIDSKPDIVISFIDVMNVTTLLSTFFTKIPVIVSERIDPHFHKIPKLYGFLRRFIYPYSKKVVVQTQSAADYFPYLKNSKLLIIPNSVEIIPNAKNSSNVNLKSIISVGRLNQQKDHTTLIKTFANISPHYPEITLTIYGEGPDRQNLEDLIRFLNLHDKVFLPGTVTNVHDHLRNADLFVFPSRYEGFPNALCEAMAIGLPVIASNCTGNVDIVTDGLNGRLFDVENVAELTQIMIDIINDFDQRKRLAKEAVKITNTYAPEKIYRVWDDIIHENVKKRKQ